MTGSSEPGGARALAIRDLVVRYGGADALCGVTLAVPAGAFVSILGPSGCGKSTLLRAVAGLEPAAGGRIEVDGRDVARLRPAERGVAFVFQSYALYPHMTVAQNIAAPLRMARLNAWTRLPLLGRALAGATHRAIDARVRAVAGQLGIEGLLDRRPSALSGGQRQRVALGRAIVREPDLFLLDEPLANLDAALRGRTRSELRALQRRLRATTLFVTHDQAEAMAISDLVAVMFEGRIHQVGTPGDLYRAPADLRVARFLAQPHLNELPAEEVRAAIGTATREGPVIVGGVPLAEAEGLIAVRPEHARVRRADAPGLPGLRVTVLRAEHGGVESMLFARTRAGTGVVIRVPSDTLPDWPEGATGVMHFALASAHLFDGEGRAPGARAAA